MSYNKYTWKKGDKITAERLNNIEEGIAEVKENDNDSQLELDKIILTLTYDSHSNEFAGTANTDFETAISLINNHKDIIIEINRDDSKDIYYPSSILTVNNDMYKGISCHYFDYGESMLFIRHISWDSQGINVYNNFDINADSTY